MNSVSEEIRAKILKTGCALLDKGRGASTWGNISARIPHTDLLAITPSGRNYRSLVKDDLVIINKEGKTVEGHLPPSSELPLHLAVYQARSDIQAIVHTHSVFASSCAVAHKNIPPIIEDLVQLIGGGVDVAEYALPGTSALAGNAVKALGEKNAALLANHGVLGCGGSLTEAMTACELVEKAAQIYIYAAQLGTVNLLSGKDIDVMHQFYLEHYRVRQEESK